MSVFLFSAVCFLVAGTALGADSSFNYLEQNLWTGICNSMNMGRQSPIDIITADVVQDSTLSAIRFSDSWSQATANGVFSNLGHNVQFTLDSDSPKITTQFAVGNYTFAQMHMHWGNRTGTGSEHRFNGEQTELEIHFVHTRTVGEELNGRNGLGVIGVYAEVDEAAPVTGFWATLDASQLMNAKDNITIYNFTLDSILPPNLNTSDYYYYEGGLTTPPCTETVQFHLLRQRIKVPGAYLNNLRSMLNSEGNALDFNYRDLQALNGRTVRIPGVGSSASVTSASLMVLAAVTLLATGFSY